MEKENILKKLEKVAETKDFETKIKNAENIEDLMKIFDECGVSISQEELELVAEEGGISEEIGENELEAVSGGVAKLVGIAWPKIIAALIKKRTGPFGGGSKGSFGGR